MSSSPAASGSRQRVSGGRVAVLLSSFLALSALAGLLMAGLVVLPVSAAGTLTRDGLDLFQEMPAELENLPSPEGSSLYASDGKTLIAKFYSENRVEVPLSKIAPVLQQAVIAIEDSRFYEHKGVDPRGLARAAVKTYTSPDVQGASTLTQQYIKNKLLEAAVIRGDSAAAKEAVSREGEVGKARKIKEIRMALQLEQEWTKDQILWGYLNVANFGQNNRGVEAASQYYFQTSAAKLDLPQAAMLAAMVQNPENLHPVRYPAAAKARRTLVLNRMLELGMITKAQRDKANSAKLPTQVKVARSGCINAGVYAYYCDYVVGMLKNDPRYAVLGKTPSDREAAIRQGGYKIVSAMDASLIREATKIVMDEVSPTDSSNVLVAAATVEPGTGRVLSLVQNRTYSFVSGKGKTEINYTVDKKYGGANGFLVGSNFKPFVLANWLAKGKGLETYVSADQTQWNKSEFKACGERMGYESFPVYNAESNLKIPAMSVLEATAKSVNLAYMDMASRLDYCQIAETAEALGVHPASDQAADPTCWRDGKPSLEKLPTQCPAMVLGAIGISPLTLAEAYATFSAEGKYCPPTPVDTLFDRSGTAVKFTKTACIDNALRQDVARGVIYAGKRVFQPGGTANGKGIAWPAAGKTGTTDDSVHTWFTGYTKQRATSVVVTDPTVYWKDAKDHSKGVNYKGGRSLNKRPISGVSREHVYGATIAAPVWRSIMNVAMDGLPSENWAGPSEKMLIGSGRRVSNVVGQSIGSATAELQSQGFRVRVGAPVPSASSNGTVVKQSPYAGVPMEPGATVTIYPGDGSLFVAPAPTPSPGATPPGGTPVDPGTGGGGNGGGGNGGGNGGGGNGGGNGNG